MRARPQARCDARYPPRSQASPLGALLTFGTTRRTIPARRRTAQGESQRPPRTAAIPRRAARQGAEQLVDVHEPLDRAGGVAQQRGELVEEGELARGDGKCGGLEADGATSRPNIARTIAFRVLGELERLHAVVNGRPAQWSMRRSPGASRARGISCSVAERLDPERHLENLLEVVRRRWLIGLVAVLWSRGTASPARRQRRVVVGERVGQPPGVDGHDDDEQWEREQQVDGLKHLE